jgi:hypothetical protein
MATQAQAFGHRAPSDAPLPDAEALTNHNLSEMISFLFIVIVAIVSIIVHGRKSAPYRPGFGTWELDDNQTVNDLVESIRTDRYFNPEKDNFSL